MLYEQQMPRYVNRLLRQDLSITPPMSSSSGKFQTIPKVNNFANRPLYLCHISVSDSSLVKIYQRIDRPPSLPFGCEQLVIFYYSLHCRHLSAQISRYYAFLFKLLMLDESFIGIAYKSESDFCSTCFISPSAKYFANCSSASISLYTDTISSELHPTSI